MDRELISADISSFQLASPSELDRGFCAYQSSSVYDLSLEGSVSIPSHEIVCEYSEIKPSSTIIRDPFNTISPSQAPSMNTMSMEETRIPLTIPAQSSTPCMLLQKTSSPDKLCVDSTATQVFWEFSFIKTDANNPHLTLGSSTLESTWSPKYKSGSASISDLPSLVWSGTSQLINSTDENQKSWREDSVGSTSYGSALVSEDGLLKQTTSACVDHKDKPGM